MRPRVVAVVAGVLLAAAVGVGAALLGVLDSSAEQRADTAAPAPGRPAVLDTPFEHFDGQMVRLSDWDGTPLVVNFWASWCPPCVAEMREAFEPVHQQVGDEVAFVGLNLQDEPDKAARVARQTGVTYDLGRDPSGEFYSAFGGFAMPTTVFLDESGAVVETHSGALTRGQLEQLIHDSFGVEAQ